MAGSVWQLVRPLSPDDVVVNALVTGDEQLVFKALFEEERADKDVTPEGLRLVMEKIVQPTLRQWRLEGRGRRQWYAQQSEIGANYYFVHRSTGAVATLGFSMFRVSGNYRTSIATLLLAVWRLDSQSSGRPTTLDEADRKGLRKFGSILRDAGITRYYDPIHDTMVPFPLDRKP